MEGFICIVMVCAVVGAAGYTMGRDNTQAEVIKHCEERNEFVMDNTAYSCKPIALVVKNKRSALETKD